MGGWDTAGRISFVHTVLVDMRERLRRSQRPDRVFEVALAAAREAGLVGQPRSGVTGDAAVVAEHGRNRGMQAIPLVA